MVELLVGVTGSREAGQACCGQEGQRGYGLTRLGVKGGHSARLRLSGQHLAMHLQELGGWVR